MAYRLPKAIERSWGPLQVDGPGAWLVLSDAHFPYHDKETIEIAFKEAKRRKVSGVLLNGDMMDCHHLSVWDKDPSAPRYIEEVKIAQQFLGWARDRLPKARVIYKAGNHEERLDRYILAKAPELFGLQNVTTPEILGLEDFGVEWVTDKRAIRLGSLNVIHGHEYRGGANSPVNPARGLFLRSKTQAMCGHFHQTSEHHEPTLEGKPKGCWSTGCACELNPPYCPLNRWNHGFAFVEIAGDGKFSVHNKRVMKGELV